MKIILITATFILLLVSLSSAQNYVIGRSVIASGGGEMSSANYGVMGTIGQPFTGESSSPSYTVRSGFWGVGGGGAGSGCEYVTGDANNSGGYNGLDITYGVNYFKGGAAPPYECECTLGSIWFVGGDVNSSCSYNGLDITYGVNYFKGGSGPIPCGDCPPNGVIVVSQMGRETITPTVVPVKDRSEVKIKK